MKPEQFIREFGLGKAREVVDGAPAMAEWVTLSGIYLKTDDFESDELAMWCESEVYWFCRCMDKDSPEFKEAMLISKLKRLVESLDLIKFYDGIERAKLKLAMGTCLSGRPPHPREVELRRAIRDHESIYGGGDES